MVRFRVSRENPVAVGCDLLALPVYAGGAGVPDAIGKALGVSVKRLLEAEGAKGDPGDVVIVPSLGRLPAARVAFVGLGEKKKFGHLELRRAAAALARRSGRAETVAAALPTAGGLSVEEGVRAFVEGFRLGQYRFDKYKKNGKPPGTRHVTVLVAPASRSAFTSAIRRADLCASATNMARDLTNVPSLDKSPASLAQEARRIARSAGLQVRVLDERRLAEGGFGGLLGVGRGSSRPPRLIELRYTRRGAGRTVALVGKGITFDSGGLNLKTASMDWMKTDMAGGAVVLAIMAALPTLKPRANVIGLVCAAENMPGGNALHPGDVLRIRGGRTVEVGDTDAEGRLVLADGISYAREQGADMVVDIATLTGAALIALGPRAFGVFGNDEALVKGIISGADRAGEYAWRLPLYPDYRKMLDSDVADIRNIGGRAGGAITAALFLQEFAEGTPWAHLDIAGPARSETEEFETPKGATGAGVRTLMEWLASL